MRLTADLINGSLSYLNALKERELDLRGHKIPTIENLGGATDHDALDLTDNDISTLTNFPLWPRMRTLLVARNRVSSIQPKLHESLPHLTMLMLPGNKMRELADLDPLGAFTRLTHLVLVENPVSSKEHYRYWVIWRCPSVRFLDYAVVKLAERKQAIELFGTATEPTDLASKILNIKSRTFDVPSTSSIIGDTQMGSTDGPSLTNLKGEELLAIRAAIANTKNMTDMVKLEKNLKEGKIPAGGDAMEE